METEGRIFTVGEFTSLINESLSDRGINEDFVWTSHHPTLPLQKRFAAAISHEVLLRFASEEDEENWDSALVLRDLFDCHACVIHIAQTYSKGIIEAKSADLFGVRDVISEVDSKKIIQRLWDRSKRFTPAPPSKTAVKSINFPEDGCVLEKTRDKLIVFVCGNESVTSPPIFKGSVTIPFSRIYQNPYTVSDDFDQPIFLYSADGYFSVIAAELLSEHGYRDVNVIKLKNS